MFKKFLAPLFVLCLSAAAFSQALPTPVLTTPTYTVLGPLNQGGQKCVNDLEQKPFNDHYLIYGFSNGAPSAVTVTATGWRDGTVASAVTLGTGTDVNGNTLHYTGFYTDICFTATSITGSGVSVTATYTGKVAGTSGTNVDVDSLPTGNNNILSEIPGVGATNLGKAESGTPANGDTGVSVLYQVESAPTATAADGKYGNPKLNAVGAAWTTNKAIGTGTEAKCTDVDTTFATLVCLMKEMVYRADDTAAVPVNIQAATTGGCTPFKYTSVASAESEHEIKATAGTLCALVVTNTAATVAYYRCSNLTAANTTPGTSTEILDLAIPGATTGAGFNVPLGSAGMAFSTALTCWIVTGEAESDVAEVGTDDVKVFATYK